MLSAPLPPRGETFDWVERVSIELTTMMLATMFDWPFEKRAELTRWSDIGIANINDPDSPVKSEQERFDELKKMAEAMAVLYNERAQQPPRFDLLSMLAHGSATKDLPLREFMGNLALLLVGGNDTTRNTMTGGVLALNQFPGEYDKLRKNPALIESMVSETIRFVTPVIHMRRTATVDTELAGQRIERQVHERKTEGDPDVEGPVPGGGWGVLGTFNWGRTGHAGRVLRSRR